MKEVLIFDDVLADATQYRDDALRLDFRSFAFEHCTFHGIALADAGGTIPCLIRDIFPAAVPTLSFFRRSPIGQEEPHFIHTDIDMGDWSAILYLNPDPPPEDGTRFWTHLATNTTGSAMPHERSEAGRTAAGWQLRETVQAKFNRLLVFPSSYFHSRAVYDNWGSGDGARLTQVTFGRGELT